MELRPLTIPDGDVTEGLLFNDRDELADEGLLLVDEKSVLLLLLRGGLLVEEVLQLLLPNG